jgi:uncharacterized alkaline shock family protein YloU
MVKFTTSLGDITISGDVFTTLAGVAATNCFGVCGMALRSVTDGLVHLLKREVLGKGVKVTVNTADNGEYEISSLSVELHIIAKTGTNLPVICNSIIEAVAYKITRDTGVAVDRVEVFVDGIMTDKELI